MKQPSMTDLFPEALTRGEALARAIPLRTLFARTSSTPGTQIIKAAGTSTEYFDHRPYEPGDDPRFIDWNAYGRTEQYTIRLFQKETVPHIDVILDYSPSLFITEEKSMRALELVYYLLVAAERVQAKARFFFVADDQPELVARDYLLEGSAWRIQTAANSIRMLDKIAIQSQSNSIVISDVLFPGNPEPMCANLTRTPGSPILFVPFTKAEASPDWNGSMQFHDCENQSQKKQVRCDQTFLARYQDAYATHTSLWENAALRYGILLRRVSADVDLAQQLLLDKFIRGTGANSL
jgi:hypothetical protein